MTTTFRVSGPFAYRGHKPGETFEADPKNKQIQAAVDRGSISEEKASGSASGKKDAGEAGGKE